MWIKTCEDSYVHSDHVMVIEYDKKSKFTYGALITGTIFKICEGDHAREIVTAIISEEKFMEVFD